MKSSDAKDAYEYYNEIRKNCEWVQRHTQSADIARYLAPLIEWLKAQCEKTKHGSGFFEIIRDIKNSKPLGDTLAHAIDGMIERDTKVQRRKHTPAPELTRSTWAQMLGYKQDDWHIYEGVTGNVPIPNIFEEAL